MRRIGSRLALLALAAAVMPACGSGGSSGGGGAVVSTAPSTEGWFLPGTAAGIHTIKANGGKGSVGAGGNGNWIQVHNWGATDGRLLKTGSIDASFTAPSDTPTLGGNARTISADTTLTVGAGLTAGVTTILGDDGLTPATGLHVLAGVTLTLGPNIDTDNADADGNGATGTLEQANLGFADGVVIEGAIKTGLRDGSPDTSHLAIFASDIRILAAGSLLTAGADAPGAGSNGRTAGNIRVQAIGTLVNRGSIRSKGGDGDAGGAGGVIELFSERYSVFNTGPVLSSGGTGSAGTGGSANYIWIQGSIRVGSAAGGGAYNSGTLTARGGDGTSGGGNGAVLYHYYNDSDGPVVSSGALDSSGGSATLAGNGGNGGGIQFNSVGGIARITGTLVSRGGNGKGLAGNGGNGNLVQISANTGAPSPTQEGCYVSADLDSSGGDGATGGNAGVCEIWNNANYAGNFAHPGTHPVVLAGYLKFESKGGDGATNGGGSGAINLYARPVFDPGGAPTVGGMFNEVEAFTQGGAGASGSGGYGDFIFLGTISIDFPTQVVPSYDRIVENTARLEVRGGAGGISGGNVAYVQIFDRFHARNSGALLCNGGPGGIGPGGNAGSVLIQTDGQTENVADLTGHGGPSAQDVGGGGGHVFVEGKWTVTQGTLSARGGAGISNNGGNGGNIELGSWNGRTLTSISGLLTVAGGPGTPAGFPGIVTIDGIRAALINGTLTFP